jgi:hypothetical protein
MDEEKIQLREEVAEQIRALSELKEMAASYGYDIGQPAKSAREAVQGLYFAYLAAVKEQVSGCLLCMCECGGGGGGGGDLQQCRDGLGHTEASMASRGWRAW